MILTVANRKGGTAKTTSAAFLAHALAEQGRTVLVIDADPQGSMLRWAELGEWEIPVRGMPTARLHVPAAGVELEASGHDAVVIDCPPSDREASIVESAIRASTHVLVPLAPTAIEVERMEVIRAMIDDLAHLGRHAAPPVAAAMFTRTNARAVANAEYRDLLAEQGWHVLRAQAAQLQRYAQAWGGPVERAGSSAYGDALTELAGVTS